MDNYMQGKKDFLDGKPMNEPSEAIAKCDYRSGYRVARSNRVHHPDWTREFVLA